MTLCSGATELPTMKVLNFSTIVVLEPICKLLLGLKGISDRNVSEFELLTMLQSCLKVSPDLS